MSNKKQIKKNDPALLEFESDAVELEHSQVPKRSRWILYTIFSLLVTAIVWASLAEVERFVSSIGQLIVIDPIIQIQPFQTSIIKKVHVYSGDEVIKDQLLVSFDSTVSQAQLESIKQKKSALFSHYRRLTAEQKNVEYVPLETENNESKDLQLNIFNKRANHKNESLKNYSLGSHKLSLELSKNKNMSANLQKKIVILEELHKNYKALYEKSFITRGEYLKVKEQLVVGLGELDVLLHEKNISEHKINEIEVARSMFIAEWETSTLGELSEVRKDLVQTESQFKAAQKANSLVELKARTDGIVLQVGQFSAGSVVQPAEPILTLMPLKSRIEALVQVPAQNIGYIRIGDEVRIKLNAFPFQQHGILQGKVRVISENATTNKDSPVAIYVVRIEIMSHELKNVPQGYRLIPGMEVVADIKIGTRHIIEYLIYPIIRVLGQSMREP